MGEMGGHTVVIYQIAGLIIALVPVYMGLWRIHRELGEVRARRDEGEKRIDRLRGRIERMEVRNRTAPQNRQEQDDIFPQ